MKQLGELLAAVSPVEVYGNIEIAVSGIAYDSRLVRPGDLFVALPGRRRDGNAYIRQALEKGAVGVVSENTSPPAELSVPFVVVANSARALSQLSAALHGYPARRLVVIGVTGTDGKTTTVHLTSAVLRAAGLRAGHLSTVSMGVGADVRRNETNHTTPQAPELQRALAEMVAEGTEYAVLEVSSHALALHRVADCEFDVAVLTNLTPEHLDFHGSFAQYREDKAKLFRMLGETSTKPTRRFGVVNADDPEAAHFRAASPVPVLTYGIDAEADVRARHVRATPTGSAFTVATPGEAEIDLETRLVGRFNVYNWLAAVAVAVGLELPAEAAVHAAATVAPVPGRIQTVDAGQAFTVVVDFAHTPNALENVLEALRAQTSGRVIAVFGHAGGRDRANRPRLAQVAGSHSEFFILTTDDPYDEDPEAIIGEIEKGAEALGLRRGRDYEKVVDRAAAIALALAEARAGDVVVIAGRGHERLMTIGRRRLPFDDAEVARDLLLRRLRRAEDAAA